MIEEQADIMNPKIRAQYDELQKENRSKLKTCEADRARHLKLAKP